MVVLPRHARRRFGNPYGAPQNHGGSPYGPPSPHHGSPNHGHPYHNQPSRMFSQQTLLLLLAGMGLGYLVTINMGHSPTSNANNLDVIVKNLEAARAASSAASNSFGSGDANAGLSSPMNMMHNQQREAAALLRGEATGQNHALYNHRRTSSDAEHAVADEDSAEEKSSAKVTEGDEAAPEEESNNGSAESGGGSSAEVAEVRPLAVNKKFEATSEAEDGDLSEAQKRFVETQKLIASQSIPTPTNPHVMKTVCF